MKCLLSACLAIGTVLSLVPPAAAQIESARSVVGCGAGGGGGANHVIKGTVGQAAIGVVSGPQWLHKIGFWASPPTSTGLEDLPPLPATYDLMQNHPNPFNPTTTIRFGVPDAARVTIRLYDIRGRVLETLVDEEQAPGWHDFVLRAESMPSGVYFYGMEAGDYREVRKLVLLK